MGSLRQESSGPSGRRKVQRVCVWFVCCQSMCSTEEETELVV